MKQFIIHLILILALFLGFMILLDKVYSYTFQNGIPRSKAQKILQENNKQYDLAFFGSSRTENHIDCKLVEKLTGKTCVNYGISGGSIGDMLMLMKIAKLNNIQFDAAYMQVDYSFNYHGLSENFKGRLVPFLKKENFSELLIQEGTTAYNQIPFYRYLQYDYIIGFRELFTSVISKSPKIDIEYGFNPKIGIGKNLAKKLPTSLKDSNEEIELMITYLDNQNIPLTFFTAPYCKQAKNREHINTLKNALPNYYNLMYVFDDKEEYFYNCGHLNIQGARAFTKLLIDRIPNLNNN